MRSGEEGEHEGKQTHTEREGENIETQHSIVKRDILNVEQRQAEEELHIIIPASLASTLGVINAIQLGRGFNIVDILQSFSVISPHSTSHFSKTQADT